MALETRKVLIELGFSEIWDEMTDRQPSYRYKFGNFELKAVELMSPGFRSTMHFSGALNTSRALSNVSFQLPLQLESRKEGVALMTHYLKEKPILPDDPQWLVHGRAWECYLPWNQNVVD